MTKEKKTDKEPEEIKEADFKGIVSALLSVPPPKKKKELKKKAGPKKRPPPFDT